MKKKILVIDDNKTVNHLLSVHLELKGFRVWAATCAQEGLRVAYKINPDLVILDIMMPEIDGWQTCKRLREISDVPIIMLTAKINESDVIQGFLLGADDYIKKPFSLEELVLRIRAVLKRAKTQRRDPHSLYNDGTLRIDLERRLIFRQNEQIHLTSTEFHLLSYLVRHRTRIVPHQELLIEVWGTSYMDAKEILSLYIHYLRDKLEDDPKEPQYIRTQWGVGYWFASADAELEEEKPAMPND